MEVLEILQKHAKDLLAEDFSLLETELDTGDYPEEYIVQCKEMIEQILLERKQEARQVYMDTLPSNILVDPASLIPGTKPKEKSPQEKLADLTKELVQMRTAVCSASIRCQKEKRYFLPNASSWVLSKMGNC